MFWLACLFDLFSPLFRSAAACPMLKKVPQVLVVHGESDGTVEYMKVCCVDKLETMILVMLQIFNMSV